MKLLELFEMADVGKVFELIYEDLCKSWEDDPNEMPSREVAGAFYLYFLEDIQNLTPAKINHNDVCLINIRRLNKNDGSYRYDVDGQKTLDSNDADR